MKKKTIRVNMQMKDGSELKQVNIFRNKELGDSIVSTKSEIEELLNYENNKNVYFGGKYIQGGIIPKQISKYEIIEDEKEISLALLNFIEENNHVYDFNSNDVMNFIIENRQEILKILI